jgi:hypothetical protein
MSLTMALFFGFVAVLLLLLAWALRRPVKARESEAGPNCLEETGRLHVSFLPQIQRALGKTDYNFLSQSASTALLRRVRQERRRIALAYLSALRGDFQSLLRMARIIASLSPQLAAMQEFERLRLTIKFAWRYETIRLLLWAGLAPIPQLNALSDLLSGLSVRMETAVREIGERAALAVKLASSIDGHDIDAALQ